MLLSSFMRISKVSTFSPFMTVVSISGSSCSPSGGGSRSSSSSRSGSSSRRRRSLIMVGNMKILDASPH